MLKRKPDGQEWPNSKRLTKASVGDSFFLSGINFAAGTPEKTSVPNGVILDVLRRWD